MICVTIISKGAIKLAKKSGIGDVIAATLGDVSKSDTRAELIPMRELHDDPDNFYPLQGFHDQVALAESIIANGVLEPLIVTPRKEGGFAVLSGRSRWRAISLPIVRNARPDVIQGVPCVVLPVMDAARKMSVIIEANRQRVKSSATLAEEAEKLTAAYTERKNAGEELPGRIRDRVAKALEVSATKLATIKATKEHLTLPGFRAQWEDGKISDSVAYEISKMQGDHQYRLLDWLINHGREASSLKIADVKKLEQQFSARPRKFDLTQEQEDALFLDAAESFLPRHLRISISECQTRAEAIDALRRLNRNSCVHGPDWAYECGNSGVCFRNGKSGVVPKITRTWAEVYDAMALIALRKKTGMA